MKTIQHYLDGIEKTKDNLCTIFPEYLGDDLGVEVNSNFDWDEYENDFQGYFLKKWYIPGEYIGLKAYFLKGEFVAISFKKGSWGERLEWVSGEAKLKTKKWFFDFIYRPLEMEPAKVIDWEYDWEEQINKYKE